MDSGPFDRRTFLTAAGATLLAGVSPRDADAARRSEALFATAYMTDRNTFGAAVLSEEGTVISRISLPARGHDVVFQPGSVKQAVVFARRPGNFACAFATDRSSEPQFFSSPEGRHFYGHGAFSTDGKLLYATENDFEIARGLVGLYDVSDSFRRIGEFPTGGIGPHDIRLMPDGRTLAVANGGIETHPDYGRAKLNIPTMEPSLAFIDTGNGTVQYRVSLPRELTKLSLRHMDGDDRGRLWIAGQHEGDAAQIVPLVHVWSDENGLSTVPLPQTATARLKGYVGSIAYNHNSDRLAVSSPRGGVMVHCPASDPSNVTVVEQRKVCGLASHGAKFAMTSADGTAQTARGPSTQSSHRWDNHLVASPRLVPVSD